MAVPPIRTVRRSPAPPPPMTADHGSSGLPADLASIIVVSDLHLGPGVDVKTGRYDPTENFTADEAFAEFLDRNAPASPDKHLLVFNGDIFDFVRITGHPETDQDFRDWRDVLTTLGKPRPIDELRNLHPREVDYGLRTDDYKSVWKLTHVASGHRPFFDALGRWNARGGWIVFVKGNHDLELYWDLVQEAIRLDAGRSAPPGFDEARILFEQEFLKLENVFIEHGHPYESITAVHGPPTLPGGTQLHLPLGSFVNRYVINHLEGLEPNLDNLKPIDNLLWRLVRRHPLKIFTILWRSLPLLRRAFRPYWWKHWFAFVVYFLTLLIPVVCIAVIILAFAIPDVAGYVERLLGSWRGILGTIGVLLPYIAGFLRDLIPKRKPKVGENHFAEGIHGALGRQTFGKQYGTIYGVLGHTHQPDIQTLPSLHGSEVVYLNSGTWIGTWSEDRPELAGRVIHSFIRFDRNGVEFAAEHCRWVADASRSVASVILRPKDGD